MTDTLLRPEGGGTDDGIPADDIDLDFVPRPLHSVAAREVAGETVLIDQVSGTVFRLDPVGSVVWSTFDGSAPLGVLVEELAEAFGADAEVVGHDVVELTRTLARIGLLAGIARPRPPSPQRSLPAGIAVGAELPPFHLPDLDGMPVDLTGLRGGPVLLVNWGPGCGYCVMIAPELDALRPALAEQGVRMVLLAVGDAATNRALLERLDIDLPVVLRSGAGDDFVDPFPGVGTPAAYLLDAEGRVAVPRAVGAGQVPGLARSATGTQEAAPPGATPDPKVKYVPGASEGMCGPGGGGGTTTAKPRVWTPVVAYRVGDLHLGVRADTPDGAEVVRHLLAAHHAGHDASAPANFSVVLGADPRGAADSGAGRKATRDLKILMHSSTTVVRSRSSRRVLLALASFLASHLPRTDDGLLRTHHLALVAGGEAVLLPPAVRAAVEQLQPRLARMGAQLIDEPTVSLDPTRRELVVGAPDLSLDTSVIDELAEPAPSRSEPPRVEPGRYPLRAWAMWDSGDPAAPGLTPAEVLSQALAALAEPPDRLVAAADVLEDLLAATPPVFLSATVEVADQLRPYLTA